MSRGKCTFSIFFHYVSRGNLGIWPWAIHQLAGWCVSVYQNEQIGTPPRPLSRIQIPESESLNC